MPPTDPPAADSGAIEHRIRALLDLDVADARESAGRHEYDGQIQDLSPSGVAAAVARLVDTRRDRLPEQAPEGHDEAHLRAFEESVRVRYGELELHRRNPLIHVENLDLACYDRPYAPDDVRAEARRAHIALWPEAVDMACASLDLVPRAVAEALIPAVRGLGDSISPGDPGAEAALQAHARLVQHIERLIDTGVPETAIGPVALQQLMAADEAMPEVDLDSLSERAGAERVRLRELLDEGCARWAPGTATPQVVSTLMADHPPADQVVATATAVTDETVAFCRDRGLVPYLDGECRVGLAPPSRRWAVAMLTWSAPYEDDGPSHYDITPPEPNWPEPEQVEWLSMFSETALPAVTTHEVAPGHFAHGRALRHAGSEVRRSLLGAGFAEGWAHYGEEMMLEEGFRAGDPRYQIGVALEALVRLTRLSCAIGLHTGEMSVADAVAAFVNDALMSEATARSEARRGTFDPTYGIYTWGKWVISDTRDAARAAWGADFSLRRFHDGLLELGSPPLGLVPAVVGSTS